MKNHSRPLLQSAWVVVQENEGPILSVFEKQKAARAHAQKLAQRFASARTELARYVIVPNSRQSFGARLKDEEEN